MSLLLLLLTVPEPAAEIPNRNVWLFIKKGWCKTWTGGGAVDVAAVFAEFHTKMRPSAEKIALYSPDDAYEATAFLVVSLWILGGTNDVIDTSHGTWGEGRTKWRDDGSVDAMVDWDVI